MNVMTTIDGELAEYMQRVKREQGVPYAFQVRDALRAKMNADRPRGPFPQPDEVRAQSFGLAEDEEF